MRSRGCQGGSKPGRKRETDLADPRKIRRFAPFGGEARSSGTANALQGGRFQRVGGASELAQVVVGAIAASGVCSGAARRASSGARECADAPRTPAFTGLLPA